MASRYRARHRFSSKLLRMRGEGRLGRPSESSTATASNGDTFGISFAIYGQLSTSLTSRRCRKTGMCYNFRSRSAAPARGRDKLATRRFVSRQIPLVYFLHRDWIFVIPVNDNGALLLFGLPRLRDSCP